MVVIYLITSELSLPLLTREINDCGKGIIFQSQFSSYTACEFVDIQVRRSACCCLTEKQERDS